MALPEPPFDHAALRNTVKPYARHAIALPGSTRWAARIEEQDDLLGRMARDVAEHKDEAPGGIKFTTTRTPPRDPDQDGIDLLVHPDAVIYRNVTAETWPRILKGHLLGGEPVADLPHEAVVGHDLLVCSHGARDARCGACGPLLAKALEAARDAAGLAPETVRIHMASHVGGHKYAGNVLVYPPGDWYGHLLPDDAPTLILRSIVNEGTWEERHRGRMAVQQHDA